MKVDWLNVDYEIKHEILKKDKWEKCEEWYAQEIADDTIRANSECIVICEAKDERAKLWYEDMEIETWDGILEFNYSGKPDVDIPIKIMIKR